MNRKIIIATLIAGAVIIPVLLFGFSDGPRIYHNSWEKRAWLGISTAELTPQLRDYFGVEEGLGVLVSEVAENSPAEKSGLKAGDVIIKADGENIFSFGDMIEIIDENEPGDELDISYVRNKKEENIQVKLGTTRSPGIHYFGHKPGRIDVYIPEIDIDIPEFDLPEIDKEELERLQEEIREEMKFHNKEMKEELEELRERMKEIKIDIKDKMTETI